MTKTHRICAALALAFGIALSSLPSGAADAPKSDMCLACHGGSFDALRDKTKDWKDEFGDAVQPHQYLDPNAANPHQGEKVVPECTGCHEEHPMPIPSGYKPKEASLSMCYGCHHMEHFQPCSDAGCHEK